MTQFDHHAAVHPHTVTDISRREPEPVTRRYYGRTNHTVTDTHIQVDPNVWQAALDACAGEPRRIQVIDEHHVEIHNDPDWRKHQPRPVGE